MRIGYIIFLIGIQGIIINRKHIIQILIGLELMLLGQIMISSTIGVRLDDIVSEILTLKIFIMAAVESAIGLTIIIGYYRIRGKIEW